MDKVHLSKRSVTGTVGWCRLCARDEVHALRDLVEFECVLLSVRGFFMQDVLCWHHSWVSPDYMPEDNNNNNNNNNNNKFKPQKLSYPIPNVCHQGTPK